MRFCSSRLETCCTRHKQGSQLYHEFLGLSSTATHGCRRAAPLGNIPGHANSGRTSRLARAPRATNIAADTSLANTISSWDKTAKVAVSVFACQISQIALQAMYTTVAYSQASYPWNPASLAPLGCSKPCGAGEAFRACSWTLPSPFHRVRRSV